MGTVPADPAALGKIDGAISASNGYTLHSSIPQQSRDEFHLHKQNDARVGHGVGQTQDPAAHDGITQVEDRHPKRGMSRVLRHTQTETRFTRL